MIYKELGITTTEVQSSPRSTGKSTEHKDLVKVSRSQFSDYIKRNYRYLNLPYNQRSSNACCCCMLIPYSPAYRRPLFHSSNVNIGLTNCNYVIVWKWKIDIGVVQFVNPIFTCEEWKKGAHIYAGEWTLRSVVPPFLFNPNGVCATCAYACACACEFLCVREGMCVIWFLFVCETISSSDKRMWILNVLSLRVYYWNFSDSC